MLCVFSNKKKFSTDTTALIEYLKKGNNYGELAVFRIAGKHNIIAWIPWGKVDEYEFKFNLEHRISSEL